MNKQELIDKLEGLKFDCPESASSRNHCYNEAINASISLAKQLDEPKKVVVPKFVADWLDKHKYSTNIIDLFSNVEYATDSDGFIAGKWEYRGEFYDWLSDNADTLFTLCDAVRYGYEVEKEPTYVISVPNCGIHKHYLARFINNNFEKPVFRHIGEEDPLFFKDKARAAVIAGWVKGKVEKWEEDIDE